MATFIGLIPSKYTIYALYGTFGRLHLPNCRFYNFCICILMGLGGASPSTVFLLFFCVRLPRQGKQFSRLCRSRGFVVYIIHLPDRHLPAFSLASSSCSALIGGRTWRSRGLPSHFSCIHGRDTGHHCRYGCLFPF